MAKTRKSNRNAKTPKASATSASKGSESSRRNGKARVSAQTKDIEDEWWSIDVLENCEDVEDRCNLRGAAAVVEACMEEFSHSKFKRTQAIVEGYRQFLAVKKERKDWDGKLFSPCFLVDKMWELHSRMPRYKRDIKLLCGHYVHYSSCDVDKSKSIAAALEQATIDAIRNLFGDSHPDESIWSVISIGMVYQGSISVDEEIPCFNHDKRLPLSMLVHDWANGEGVSTSDVDFYYDRRRIKGDETPLMLGMRKDDDIEAFSKGQILILLRDTNSGYEARWLHDREDPLFDLMNSHIERMGGNKSSLIFVFKGKRIFGHEYTRELKMAHYDVIKAMSVDSYKCVRCICCNPQQDLFNKR